MMHDDCRELKATIKQSRIDYARLKEEMRKGQEEMNSFDFCRRIINRHWSEWMNLRDRLAALGHKRCLSCGKPLEYTNCFCASDNMSFCTFRWLRSNPDIILEWITK